MLRCPTHSRVAVQLSVTVSSQQGHGSLQHAHICTTQHCLQELQPCGNLLAQPSQGHRLGALQVHLVKERNGVKPGTLHNCLS